MHQKILLLITCLFLVLPITGTPKKLKSKQPIKIRLPLKQNYDQAKMMIEEEKEDTSNTSNSSLISKKRTLEDTYEERFSTIINESNAKKLSLDTESSSDISSDSIIGSKRAFEPLIEELCESFKKVKITTRKQEEDCPHEKNLVRSQTMIGIRIHKEIVACLSNSYDHSSSNQ